MSKRPTHNRLALTKAAIDDALIEERDDDLLDSVITASVLVANADGRIQAEEREMAVDFLLPIGNTFTHCKMAH